MEDRYNREERRYDHSEEWSAESQGAGEAPAPGEMPAASSDFPWQDRPGGVEEPAESWAEHPETWAEYPADDLTSVETGYHRNNMAIAGFVCSLVMWFPIPYVNIVIWIAALTCSSIGLKRSRRDGLPYKGLAIAGLCISLIGVVVVAILVVFLTTSVVLSN